MKVPKISVCVATFNGEKFIREQLVSILPQLKDNDEVVISDDGSTDNTLEIIKSIHDKRIRVYSHVKNKSLENKYLSSFYFASYNFENAIIHATGDVIYLCDQDDIWAEDRIQKTLPLLLDTGFVMCNYAVIDAQGKVIFDKYLKSNPIGDSLLWNLWKIPFRGCCMALKRSILDMALPFPSNCINHDIWIGLLLARKGYKCQFIDEPLHFYRDHTTNVSSVVGKSPNSVFFKIGYRLRLLYQVLTYKHPSERGQNRREIP